MLTEFVGVFEEKENAGAKITCSVEKLPQSIAPPFFFRLVKVKLIKTEYISVLDFFVLVYRLLLACYIR